jgi:hypothetical protein
MEVSMHADFAANTVQTLIATIPDQRLRELVTEILTAAVRCLTAETAKAAASTTAAPANGRRRHHSRDKARAHWSRARRDAENAKHRERRALARAEGAGNGRKRRGRKPSAGAAAGNGAEAAANGRHVVKAQALWQHAAKLEPKEPWRAVVRELGIAEAAAQAAQRDGILPCTPRAAARFLTL